MEYTKILIQHVIQVGIGLFLIAKTFLPNNNKK